MGVRIIEQIKKFKKKIWEKRYKVIQMLNCKTVKKGIFTVVIQIQNYFFLNDNLSSF